MSHFSRRAVAVLVAAIVSLGSLAGGPAIAAAAARPAGGAPVLAFQHPSGPAFGAGLLAYGAPATRTSLAAKRATGLSTLVSRAQTDINSYWQRTFTRWHKHYQAPRAPYAYSDPLRTLCGVLEPDNAEYCPDANRIYYDPTLLSDARGALGDFAPVTIVAHEWGHLVQNELGILGHAKYSRDVELQADCFAGAYAGNANARGWLTRGDLDGGVAALYAAGDPPDVPWYDRYAHGQPDDRVASFVKGYKGGADKCR